MGHTVENTNAPITGDLLRTCVAPFAFVGKLLVSLADANPRMKQVSELNRMSDEELAAQGLNRVDEVNRIFGDRFYL